MVRNLSSVGIDLNRHLDSGLLRIHAARTDQQNADHHLLELKNLLEEHQTRCLVIDPLSAMLKAGGEVAGTSVAQRLVHLTKQRGITSVFSSLLGSATTASEGTPLQVSTLADTWIHLSYADQAGERNRALSIVKSRGTGHSNQVRELRLSDQGIDLADVYAAEGEVLMGTLRWQKEQAERQARARARAENERRRRAIELELAQLQARAEDLQREMALRESELAFLISEQTAREERWEQRLDEGIRRRSGDTSAAPPAGKTESAPLKADTDQGS
jgi:circadian clock protein KaiC